MVDRSLAGFGTVDTYAPFELWAGEPNGQSTQGTAKTGLIFGEQDANGQTSKVGIVAVETASGKLVPWNPAGVDGSETPVGFLPHYLDTSATGYNADTATPYFISGHPNIDRMKLPAAQTYATTKAAFARTMVNPQKLA